MLEDADGGVLEFRLDRDAMIDEDDEASTGVCSAECPPCECDQIIQLSGISDDADLPALASRTHGAHLVGQEAGH